MQKIIYVHNNYEPDNFPKEPDESDRFYTYGFGSNLARHFKFFYPEYEVEMWRIDSEIDRYYEKTVENVKFRIFPSFRINKYLEYSHRFIKEMKKEIKKSNPILFVSHSHSWLLYQVAYFFRDSYIVTSHHGCWSPFYRIKYRKGFKKLRDFIEVKVEKYVMKNVDYFLVCDYFQIPYIQQAAPDCNYTIFSTGLDVSKMKPVAKTEAREYLGWKKNKKYLLYVGKLYDLKQTKEMIELWLDIKKEKPEVELVIIGNTAKDEFYPLAVKSGAMVLGRILNKDLRYYYSAADIYLLLALRDDFFGGTGIAPLESLACNTPVVSYSMRNYLGDNISEIAEVPCTLEGYRSAIIKVLEHPEQYKNMRESVEKYYSLKVMNEKAEKVFRELTQKNIHSYA